MCAYARVCVCVCVRMCECRLLGHIHMHTKKAAHLSLSVLSSAANILLPHQLIAKLIKR